MHSWKDLIQPRDDIISQRFDEAMFTAALDDVIAKREKNPIYHDAPSFFDNTHITRGLRKVIIQVFSALMGKKSGNNVIELRTTFGGGKTHSLICLYHLSQNPSLFSTHGTLVELQKELKFNEKTQMRVAVLVGSRENVSKQRSISIDGKEIGINTWIGYMAYQLGGENGFKLVAPNDRDKTAPGKDTLNELLDSIGESCLILMDEAVAYLSSLAKIDRTLYSETLQFIQQLTEVVSKRDRCAFVFSLPETKLECIDKDGENAKETLEKVIEGLPSIEKEETLAIAKKVTQRAKTSIDPVEYTEIFDIIRKRLFKKISPQQIEQIRVSLKELWTTYKSWGEKFLPDEIFRSAGTAITWEEKLQKSYPFHPALIDVFYTEWGAHSQFQRTRAILRIFAKVLNYFWKSSEDLSIIMPGDLPFDKDEDIKTELLTYMGANFESVIADDMKRSQDLENSDKGDYLRWHVYSRLFRSIFLHSLPVGGSSHGVLEREVLLDCVHTNMTPAIFKDALRDLKEHLFHLFQEGNKYVVKFDINLNAMIVDECERVNPKKIDEFLWKKMESLVPKSYGAVVWPDISKDIPEKPSNAPLAGIIYVICSHSLSTTKMAMESGTSTKLQEFVTMRGSTPRVFKNGIFFVMMNTGSVGDLVKITQRYLAMDQILAGLDSKDFQQLNKTQLGDLIQSMYDMSLDDSLKSKLKSIDSSRKLISTAGNDCANYLLNAYSHVAHWNGKSFDLYEISTVKTKLIERVQDTLVENEIVMTQIAPGYISSQIKDIISLETLWNNFFQITGEIIPATPNVLQSALSNAIEQKKIAYCVYAKGRITSSTQKPDDFPTWRFGIKIDPTEIKITTTSWLIPAKDAEQIIANGETPPSTPVLDSIPVLTPFENKVCISWQAILKAKFYKLFRDTALPVKFKDANPLYEGLQTEFTDELREPGVYHYIIIAGNEYGASAPSEAKSIEYRLNYPPTTPKLKPFSPRSIVLPDIKISWEASKGAEEFILLQSENIITKFEEGTKIYKGTAGLFDQKLPINGNYYFAVVATNKHGISGVSNCEGVSYGKKTPPMAPKLMVKPSIDGKNVEITWTEIEDAKGYRLYKHTEQISKIIPRLKKLIDDDIVSFRDQLMQVGKYYYVVVAYNDYGPSVLSNCEEIEIYGEKNQISVSLNIEPDFIMDFSDNIAVIFGDFIRIGAEPHINITIKAKIPNNITKMQQTTLKSKLEEILRKISSISNLHIDWTI